MTVFRRYAALLRLPGAVPAVLAVLVGRLSFGMTGLAVLLLIEERNDSYAEAGVAAAVYAVTLAIASPMRSRTVDRDGQTRVLRVSGVVHPLAIAGFLVAVLNDAPRLVYLPLLLVAGLAVPPLGAVMRALWAELAPDEETRGTAYALEAVLIETSFVLGPLLVGLISAAWGPAPAVAAAGGAAAGGALALSMTHLSRQWRPHGDVASRHVAGPLVSPGIRVLLAVFAFTGASFGAVEVAVPAMAEAGGYRPSTGGLLLAIWAGGSAIGGLVYGGRTWRLPGERLYLRLVGLLALGAALPMLAPNLPALGALLFVYGLSIAPSGACANLLMSRHAPPGTLTEAFGWTTTAIFLGASLGNVLAGLVVETWQPRAGLLLTAGLGSVALSVALLGRVHLARAQVVTAMTGT